MSTLRCPLVEETPSPVLTSKERYGSCTIVEQHQPNKAVSPRGRYNRLFSTQPEEATEEERVENLNNALHAIATDNSIRLVSCLAGGKVDLAPIYQFVVGTRTRGCQAPRTFQATLLHVAFYKRALESVKILLHLGASTEEGESEQGDRPLHVAVRVGSYWGVCLLLEYGADPASTNRLGNTPLHLAAAAGKLHICRRLLRAGAPATFTNRMRETPWQVAVLAGSQTCLACADIIEAFFQTNRRGHQAH